MTHDPYQTHPTFGAYAGLTNPFSSAYPAMQTSAINPAAAVNPLAANAWGLPTNFAQQFAQQVGPQGYSGIPGFGPSTQMFGQSPFTNVWQNPLVAAALQNQLAQNQLAAVAQQVAQQLNPILAGQQIGSPYQQPNQQYQQYQQPYQQPFQQPNQLLGQAAFGQQQQASPFAQFNNPFAQPSLAPQSWVGQGQAGQFGGQQGQFGGVQGQIHPLLLQAVTRAIQQTQGVSPWGGY